MPYRRTENVERKLAARHAAILTAARTLAAEGGMAALQIAPVAEHAGIAAGTVYRYFPSKTELVAALVAATSQAELAAIGHAADAAPGPLSALAAAIATWSARSLAARRLAYALLAEPCEPDIVAIQISYRRAIAEAFAARIKAAIVAGHLPDQDAAIAATALSGALTEALFGPLAAPAASEGRALVQAMTLLALRALGIADARARGLVVQTAMPASVDL